MAGRLQTIAREDAPSAGGPPAPSSYRRPAMVTGVADGDTLYASVDGHSIRIRLAPDRCPREGTGFRPSIRAVPAPTGGQEAGRADLEVARPVWPAHRAGCRRWPRCECEQVKRGFAWVFRRYSNDAALVSLEAQAKSGAWVCGPIPTRLLRGSGGLAGVGELSSRWWSSPDRSFA